MSHRKQQARSRSLRDRRRNVLATVPDYWRSVGGQWPGQKSWRKAVHYLAGGQTETLEQHYGYPVR
jgi:hypothetical protein